MIGLYEMVYFTYKDDLKVQEMLDQLKTAGKGKRLPFLGENKQPIYMLHKSAVDEALLERAKAGDDVNQVMLKDLFDKVSGLKELAEGSFGVVAEDATLANALAEMRRVENCQDVFATENGSKNSSVVGWVTNSIIEQHSKVLTKP